MKKPSNPDLDIMHENCLRWINKLGITDWDCKIVVGDKLGANGQIYLQPDGRKAVISLCKKRDQFTDIPYIAKHECLELLLGDIRLLLQAYYSEDMVDDEIHKVVNRLMMALE